MKLKSFAHFWAGRKHWNADWDGDKDTKQEGGLGIELLIRTAVCLWLDLSRQWPRPRRPSPRWRCAHCAQSPLCTAPCQSMSIKQLLSLAADFDGDGRLRLRLWLWLRLRRMSSVDGVRFSSSIDWGSGYEWESRKLQMLHGGRTRHSACGRTTPPATPTCCPYFPYFPYSFRPSSIFALFISSARILGKCLRFEAKTLGWQ